ncbi:hypothetical protein MAR_023530 [Mya arenaria]|uniref:Uncharacterized protein n=1 Tax=Mya arenaria TaxID=6604 RepID=A0ABY7DN90_MYAAR|nr:hypothetical protein MAR_023530 [Mya arenaria]
MKRPQGPRKNSSLYQDKRLKPMVAFFLDNYNNVNRCRRFGVDTWPSLYCDLDLVPSNVSQNKVRCNLLYSIVTQSKRCRGDEQRPHWDHPCVLVCAPKQATATLCEKLK